MNRIDKQNFIIELNKLINHYVKEYDLFNGGCCFSAYLLTKYLSKAGISYKTILFQYDDILNERNFNNAINGNGTAHVAVEVTYKLKRMIIGDCSTIYRYFDYTGEKYKVRRYRGIQPEELREAYLFNDWNPKYHTVNNYYLEADIKRIFKKYSL